MNPVIIGAGYVITGSFFFVIGWWICDLVDGNDQNGYEAYD